MRSSSGDGRRTGSPVIRRSADARDRASHGPVMSSGSRSRHEVSCADGPRRHTSGCLAVLACAVPLIPRPGPDSGPSTPETQSESRQQSRPGPPVRTRTSSSPPTGTAVRIEHSLLVSTSRMPRMRHCIPSRGDPRVHRHPRCRPRRGRHPRANWMRSIRAGSVTGQLVRTSPVPVLAVRTPAPDVAEDHSDRWGKRYGIRERFQPCPYHLI